MEQGALKRDDVPSTGQIVVLAIGLWFFSSFILAVVAVGAAVNLLWWFVSTPVLAAFALSRRWRMADGGWRKGRR